MGCGSSKNYSPKRAGTLSSSSSEDEYSDEEDFYDEKDSDRGSSGHKAPSESEGYHSTNRTEEEIISNYDEKGVDPSPENDLYGMAEVAASEADGKSNTGPPESPLPKKTRRKDRRKKRNARRKQRKQHAPTTDGYESEPDKRAGHANDSDRGYSSEPERTYSNAKKKSTRNNRRNRGGSRRRAPKRELQLQSQRVSRPPAAGGPGRVRVAGGSTRRGQPPPPWKPWKDPTKEFSWKNDYPGEPMDW